MLMTLFIVGCSSDPEVDALVDAMVAEGEGEVTEDSDGREDGEAEGRDGGTRRTWLPIATQARCHLLEVNSVA